MQSFFLVRGIHKEQEEFLEHLRSSYVPAKARNKETGKEEQVGFQLNVRPWNIIEVAYPRDQHNYVMNLMRPSIKDYGAKYKMLYKLVRSFGKFMGLKKMKQWTNQKTLPFPYFKNIGVHAIGFKEDFVDPKTGIEYV